MAQRPERDFPLGHPAAVDTVPGSPEHLAWLRVNDSSLGERDFPVGHIKAADTPGNTNHVTWQHGVDPVNAHLEAFTGRTPEAAAAVAKWSLEQSMRAKESPALEPIDAEVANAALAAERKRLKVDALNADQHAAVLARLQAERDQAKQDAVSEVNPERERALKFLLHIHHSPESAVATLEKHGLDAVLAAAKADTTFKE